MERPVWFWCFPSARNEKIWLKEKRANDSTSSIVLQELTQVLTSFNQSLLPSPYVGSFWAWWSRNMSSRGTETRTSFLSCFDNIWRTLYIERAPALHHYSFFFFFRLFFLSFFVYLFFALFGCYSFFLQIRRCLASFPLSWPLGALHFFDGLCCKLHSFFFIFKWKKGSFFCIPFLMERISEPCAENQRLLYNGS